MQICKDALPHLKAKNPGQNGRGLYFERLMNFGRGAVNDNQLEFDTICLTQQVLEQADWNVTIPGTPSLCQY